ncbi:MAG: glycosyltransferase family 4 protein [gamma proteobacterium symbiont of Bathyaustriella thionipta]|nr:glycosyltransferase family 4 protein [gamma proteobacterium symbiont of Bathyaustriella thionipta]
MSTKKTLLVLTSTFPRWVDDTEPRFVYDLSQRLTGAFKVMVLTPHHAGAKRIEDMQGMTIYRYRYAPDSLETLVYNGGIVANLSASLWKWFLLPVFLMAQLGWIIRLLVKHEICVIHAHWLLPQAWLALIARKLLHRKVKIICTSHGGDLFALRGKLATRIKRWIVREVDELAVVSKAMQSKALELSPDLKDKIHVAPMGVDLQHTFIEQKQRSREARLVLFAGRLVEKKGVDTLIKAMQKIIKQDPEVHLKIVGSGPQLGFYKALTNEFELARNITFQESVSHKELVQCFASAAVAVFPFRPAETGDVEGLGLVMIEALGCLCPVIAGDVAAAHDVITDNKSGLLFPSGDDAILAEKIIFLLNHKDIAKKLAKAGCEYVISKYDWPVVSTRYESLLDCSG